MAGAGRQGARSVVGRVGHRLLVPGGPGWSSASAPLAVVAGRSHTMARRPESSHTGMAEGLGPSATSSHKRQIRSLVLSVDWSAPDGSGLLKLD